MSGVLSHSNEYVTLVNLTYSYTKVTLIMLPTSSELVNENHYQPIVHVGIILEI